MSIILKTAYELPEPAELLASYSLVFAEIGVSAAGKSTIARHMVDAGLMDATPTWTTRQPRTGETDTCYDHRFVSDEEFDREIERGGFIHYEELYGELYGLPFLRKPPPGKEALVVLKPVFIPKFIEQYPQARIYQIEVSYEKLEPRMQDRGQSKKDIAKRLEQYDDEASASHHYRHVVFNNDGLREDTFARFEACVRNDRKSYNQRQVAISNSKSL